jgi:bifunctional ADP-heptose synthase (sugar kinase/adenylyltransferase)
MKTVMVAGDFGKIHSGHLLHIAKAYELGDWLYIVTHYDYEITERKGYIPDLLENRVFILNTFLKGLGGYGEVIMALDRDGTVAATIKYLGPNIFAKGGEYNLQNMPSLEIDACKEVGCEIIFGIGETLNQSRLIANK